MLTPPVTHAAVCKWETGQTEPGISHLLQISELLGIDIPSVRDGVRDPMLSEMDSYLLKMTETQRSAVLGVARAMVDC